MTDPTEKAMVEIPGDWYPFDITVLDATTGEVLWEQHCEEAGIIDVPDFPGRACAVRIVSADGRVWIPGRSDPVRDDAESWERCAGCQREFRAGYVCYTHSLCGLCHPREDRT